jgi:hypothetical protein
MKKLFLTLFILLSPTPAFALLASIPETADYMKTTSPARTPDQGADYKNVSETTADDSAYLTYGTTAGYEIFKFTPPAKDTTMVDLSVTVYYRCKDSSSGTNSITAYIMVGGTKYAGSGTDPTTSFITYSNTWNTNPYTAAAWTLDELCGLNGNSINGYGIISTDANPTIIVSSIMLTYNYSIASPTPTTTPTYTPTNTPTITPSPSPTTTPTVTTTATPTSYYYRKNYIFPKRQITKKFYSYPYTATTNYNSVTITGFSLGADHTPLFQSAINQGKKYVMVPNPGFMINVKPGLFSENIKACICPASNQEIIFADGTTICPIAGSMTNTANSVLFDITNKSNVTITSTGTLHTYMRKLELISDPYPQWRHTIQVQNSQWINISNLYIHDSMGDGIFTGGAYGPTTHLNISNVTVDNPNRSCIVLDNNDTALIDSCTMQNAKSVSTTAGTNCGFHVELDFRSDDGGGVVQSIMKNITLSNSVIQGNSETAIMYYIVNSYGDGNTITVNVQSCTLSAYALGWGTLIKCVGGGDIAGKNSLTINDTIGNSCNGSILWADIWSGIPGQITLNRCSFTNFSLYGVVEPIRLYSSDLSTLYTTQTGSLALNNVTLNDSRGALGYMVSNHVTGHASGSNNFTGNVNMIGSASGGAYLPTTRTNCSLTGLTISP